MEKIRSVRILLILGLLAVALFCGVSLASAAFGYNVKLVDNTYYTSSDITMTGPVPSGYGAPPTPDSFYYQKFTTPPYTVAARKINFFTNTWFFSGYVSNKYWRMGISADSGGLPAGKLPCEWYNLTGYKLSYYLGYTSEIKFYDLTTPRAGYRNLTLTSVTYLEPNHDYYLVWFMYQGYMFPIGTFTVNYPRTNAPGVFGALTVHKGGRYATTWNTGGSAYQYAWILWGDTMDADLIGGATLVDDRNASFYEVANNNYTYGKTWTWGYWLGSVNTTTTTFDTNTTLYWNSSTTTKHFTLTGLTPGKFYHIRPWIHTYDGTTGYGIYPGNEVTFLTRPTNVSNFVNTTRTTDGISAFTWTKGSAAETVRTVIFSSETGYVSDPLTNTTAVKVYNGTGNSCNIDFGSEHVYLTIYSYVYRTELSDGQSIFHEKYSLQSVLHEDFPGILNYRVNITNEKTPWGKNGSEAPANYWDYHVSSLEGTLTDGTVKYLHYDVGAADWSIASGDIDLLTFRYNVNKHGDVGTGTDNKTMFERNLIVPTNSSEMQDMKIYIPNVPVVEEGDKTKGSTKPVTIFLRDRTGGLYSLDQNPQIYIYANGEKNYASKDARCIHSDYVQADYATRTFLVIGDQYAFYGKSDSMNMTRLGSLIIFDDEYTIDVTTTNVQNVSWTSIIDISTGWLSNVNLWLWSNIVDSTNGLTKVEITLYDANGNEVDSQTLTGSQCWAPPAGGYTYKYATGLANSSQKVLYYAEFKMEYSKGTTQWTSVAWIFWNPEESGMTMDIDKINSLFTQTIGPSPVYIPDDPAHPEGPGTAIPYMTLVLTGLVILFFFLFRPENAAFAVFIVAAILGITRIIGMTTEAIIPITSIAIIALLGVLMFIIFHEGEGQTVHERLAERGRGLPGYAKYMTAGTETIGKGKNKKKQPYSIRYTPKGVKRR